jgi:hypothetical protein
MGNKIYGSVLQIEEQNEIITQSKSILVLGTGER